MIPYSRLVDLYKQYQEKGTHVKIYAPTVHRVLFSNISDAFYKFKNYAFMNYLNDCWLRDKHSFSSTLNVPAELYGPVVESGTKKSWAFEIITPLKWQPEVIYVNKNKSNNLFESYKECCNFCDSLNYKLCQNKKGKTKKYIQAIKAFDNTKYHIDQFFILAMGLQLYYGVSSQNS